MQTLFLKFGKLKVNCFDLKIIYFLDSYVGHILLRDEKDCKNIILIIIGSEIEENCQVYNV